MQWPKGKGHEDNTIAKRKKDKKTNNDLRNTTQKTKDRATRRPLNTGGKQDAPEG